MAQQNQESAALMLPNTPAETRQTAQKGTP
jgi:hypothetical protein